MKLDGISRNVVVYNTMVKCFAREGKIEKIEALLKEMKQEGIEPNARTYSTVLSTDGLSCSKVLLVTCFCISLLQQFTGLYFNTSYTGTISLIITVLQVLQILEDVKVHGLEAN